MLKVSQKTEYAMRAMIELAIRRKEDEAALVPARSIAERQHIPLRFLEQQLGALHKAGLVESFRGRRRRVPPVPGPVDDPGGRRRGRHRGPDVPHDVPGRERPHVLPGRPVRAPGALGGRARGHPGRCSSG